MNNIIVLKHRSSRNIEELLALWERSVRASHSFLKNSDILELIPDVTDGLLHIETLLCLKDSSGKYLGFLGLEQDKVEMLFIDSDELGKGFGKTLLQYAIEHFSIRFVDVNEQNAEALAFYQKKGFTIFQRSNCDGQGRPFPLLHLSNLE